jgi:penicillin-binding protein 1C
MTPAPRDTGAAPLRADAEPGRVRRRADAAPGRVRRRSDAAPGRFRRRLGQAALGAAALVLALLGGAAAWIAWPLPVALREPQPVPSVTLLDRSGLPLRTTRAEDGSRAGWLTLDRIDPDIIRAFIAAEDQRFFRHRGVDVRAVARAALDNARQRRVVSGASTISMQTARLLRGSGRSRSGKIAQAMWALRLEAHLEKHDILERYLNRVPLGQGTVGVAAAAALYFDAPATDVSVGQAALLAGFARSPARDNMIAAPRRAAGRRELVLQRMVDRGFISAGDASRAAEEPVEARLAPASFLAPHFTTWVLGRHAHGASGAVRTTLDLDLQRALEAEVRHAVATLADRAAEHAAIVVLDNASGDVLAWVGSPDFAAGEDGQVDMVTSRRQPGSALKPFLYGLAFDRGFTAASVLPDVPRTYATAGGPYTPQNYDRRFRGPVRAREALASSWNVPAVELAERLGTGAFLRVLHDAGFASLSRAPEHYGLGLALGNGDVTLLELANAYRGIANGGVWQPARVLREDAAGLAGRRFMSRPAAALVLDILSDPVARMPGFGSETPLDFPFRAAAKTGTSRHYTDNWAVATTARFTVAAWVGNFSGRPMQRVSGITGAGPLLHRAVLEVARRHPPGMLVDAERAGLTPVAVCMLSGMLATAECPSLIEWFTPGTEPQQPDGWQAGGRITLPAEYAEWAAGQDARRGFAARDGTADGRRLGSAPVAFRIASPRDGDEFEAPIDAEPRYASIPLLVAGSADSVRWAVNGADLPRNRWQLEAGTHVITARSPDGARDSVRITVRTTVR